MSTRRRLTGAWLALVAAVLVVATTAGPASAHAELVSTDPAEGATVQSMPRTVTLTFSEQVRTPAFVKVTGPAGDVATGEPRIVDDRVVQSVDAGADPGSYEVSYRISSADGHAVGGSVPFTLAGAGQPQDDANESPAAPPPDDSGMSTGQLVLLLGALGLGLAAIGVGTRRALRRSVAMVEGRRSERPSARR